MSKGDTAPATDTKKVIKAPEGYDDVGRPDIDGWFKATEDLVIHGRIVGFFAFKQIVKDKEAPGGYRTQTREAICLKVYGNDTRAYKKGDKTGFILKEGQVGAISMMYALEDIRRYTAKRGQAWIHFLRKEDIGGGQTVWKADVKCRGDITDPVRATISDNSPTSESQSSGSTDGDDGDVPF